MIDLKVKPTKHVGLHPSESMVAAIRKFGAKHERLVAARP
jgi:hypothetical protein